MIFLFFLYKLVFLFFSFILPPEKRIKTFILYLGVKGLEAEDEVFFKHFVSISEIHPVFHFWGSKITPVHGKGLRTLTGCLSEVRKGRKPPLRFKHSEGHTAWRVGPCRGPALRCRGWCVSWRATVGTGAACSPANAFQSCCTFRNCQVFDTQFCF